eukprot:CAMPEP_0197178762 /NCGR_PEP_ID=MMETSP1423-20130617/3951_1 /TAXON_ID=476441 /ORGANISM="Pseudo-nitzschia heimii, Strain UNC1101" /LENGTH=45 /DNA_ID= /DNA_START= /DNA_END= /DNA_ORIENTATION=
MTQDGNDDAEPPRNVPMRTREDDDAKPPQNLPMTTTTSAEPSDDD